MSYALALSNPGSDIDKYLGQVYQIPVLTREEELELTTEFFETEDVKLAHKLVPTFRQKTLMFRKYQEDHNGLIRLLFFF